MERYQRQIPIIGADGQRKLERSKVAVIGLGGLGCNVITHLAMAGVGKFIIADGQSPEPSNLNRQFIYAGGEGTKAELSAEWITKLNPRSSVKVLDTIIDETNVKKIGKCDIIMDCLDNRKTRMIVNRYAFANNIKIVHGGVDSLFGQVTVIIPGVTPCLECILPKKKDENAASISPMVGTIASIQALEAVKILTGAGSPLSGKLLSIDASDNEYRITGLKKRDGCGCCSAKP